jgi:glycosyltransferase involved in cell wall biosynthesis
MKFLVNGLFLSQKTTGVHRFARELLSELDSLVNKGDIAVVIPLGTSDLPEYKNIGFIESGKHRGYLWEQLDFPRTVSTHKCVSINLCNSEPLLKPGIMTIHDAAYKTHPEYFKTLHGRLSVLWHRLVYKQAARSKYPIITVSYFSKYTLIDTYKIDPKRISVIGNGWQHILKFTPDETILKKNNLEPRKFFFTLGNINYNKNTIWVVKYAKQHPNDTFVLSGIRRKNSNVDIDDVPNVKWLGYLSDEEIAALYKTCKAFIFPSIHEGFGIPPMEAMSFGTPIVVANTSCLPEIFKGCAHYIDPYDTDVNLDEILKEKVEPYEDVLERYGWKISAQMLYNLISNYRL